jgi:hypothetical protein
MSEADYGRCEWKECDDLASNHIVCSESQEVGWTENFGKRHGT